MGRAVPSWTSCWTNRVPAYDIFLAHLVWHGADQCGRYACVTLRRQEKAGRHFAVGLGLAV